MKWIVLGFLIVVPVLYLGPGKSFARTLTDTDTHQYLIDPIFDNLWFGLYGPDGKNMGGGTATNFVKATIGYSKKEAKFGCWIA